MDGVMVGFIARELNETLAGGRVDKVSQPEQDEVVLSIRNHGENHSLFISVNPNRARANLTRERKSNPLEPSSFCMLMRKHLVNSRLLSAAQYEGDRILHMDFECMDDLGYRVTRRLVCEFMGRHSNLILVSDSGSIIDSVRHVNDEISRVRRVLPGLTYEDPPAHGKISYDSAGRDQLCEALIGASGTLESAIPKILSGMSPRTARELSRRAAGREGYELEAGGIEEISGRLAALLSALPQMTSPRVICGQEGAPIDVTPFDYLINLGLTFQQFDTVSGALEAYFTTKDSVERFSQKSASINKVIKNNIARCEKKLALQNEALATSEKMDEYRIKGELLTASQASVKAGMKSVALPNYYDPDCAEIVIELDEKLSPGANAQRYFKLYHKAKSAGRLAVEQIKNTTEELEYLEGQLNNLQVSTGESELNEIRLELVDQGYVRANHNRRQMKKLPPSEPLKFVSSEGIPIYVGKNNLQNESLTFGARPGEWWLHAKDMPGSHVIVAAEEAGEETMRQAASLAAYYSKGRSGTAVPVDYTRRRYVKKPGGAKPGYVIYTNQRTIYAPPLERI